MITRDRYKRYIKSISNDITFYIGHTRLYKGNLEKTTRYQQYIKHSIYDLIYYLNKF